MLTLLLLATRALRRIVQRLPLALLALVLSLSTALAVPKQPYSKCGKQQQGKCPKSSLKRLFESLPGGRKLPFIVTPPFSVMPTCPAPKSAQA